jgi:hypothetical protein
MTGNSAQKVTIVPIRSTSAAGDCTGVMEAGMRALVVYESMFGSTRQLAEAIAESLGATIDVQVARVVHADQRSLTDVDLLVVGAPTHGHGMPRASTRKGAPDYVLKICKDLVVEEGAVTGPGVREWLGSLSLASALGAGFDTRVRGPSLLTGRASRGITRLMTRIGITVVVPPESFLVDSFSKLVPGEVERARVWGTRVALQAVAIDASSRRRSA